MEVADGARIPRCCGCGVGWRYSSDWTPSLGTSMYHGCGPKKTKKKKKKKEGKKLRTEDNVTYKRLLLKQLSLLKINIDINVLANTSLDNYQGYANLMTPGHDR